MIIKKQKILTSMENIIDYILRTTSDNELRKITKQMIGEQRRYDKFTLIRTSRNYQRKWKQKQL